MICKSCGNEISSEFDFCPICGKKCELEEISVVKAETVAPAKTFFCSNCGRAAVEGEAFCKYCGYQFSVDGTKNLCPNCHEPVEPGTAFCAACGFKLSDVNRGKKVEKEKIEILGRLFLEYVKAYFLNPIESTKKAKEEKNRGLLGVLFSVYGIISGLSLFACLMGARNIVMGFLQGIFGSYIGDFSIGVSLIVCFFCGIILAAVSICLYSLLYFVIAKLLKEPCAFLDGVCSCIANCVLPCCFLLVSVVLFFLSIWVGFVTVILSQIAWSVMGIVALFTVVPKTDTGKFWVMYVLGFFIALMINLFISWQIDLIAIKQMSISSGDEKVTISRILSEQGIGGLDDLVEELMYEIF